MDQLSDSNVARHWPRPFRRAKKDVLRRLEAEQDAWIRENRREDRDCSAWRSSSGKKRPAGVPSRLKSETKGIRMETMEPKKRS